MHVSVKTLHGLRALSKLAGQPDTYRSAQELAAQKYIDRDYLIQILNELKNENIIASKKGPSGGYVLARDPESITLGEVFRTLEGPTVVSPCTQPEYSDCQIIQGCSTQDVLALIASEIDGLLDRLTLADIQDDDSNVNQNETLAEANLSGD